MRIVSLALERVYPLDLPAEVRRLLRRLPPEHLLGISRITLSGAAPLDERPGADVMGQYFEACDGAPAHIMLYPDEMEREVPRWVRGVPLVWRVLLAETLFHEIGHHYQRFTHGIRRSAQEDHAEDYGLRHARAAFPWAYRGLHVWRAGARVGRRLRLRWLGWRRARGGLSADGLYELGRLHWEREDWPRVIAAWREALTADPGHDTAREWLPRARRRHDAELRRRAARSAGRTRGGRNRRRKRRSRRR